MSKRIYVQPYFCMGCEECVESCSKEHGWQSNSFVEWIDTVYPTSLRCAQCEDAPCVKVCPMDALTITKDYGVQIDVKACIGCGSCRLACPFGIPHINANTGKMAKCDLCIDRQKAGKLPACVQNCPYGALILVDVDDLQQTKLVESAKKDIEAGRAMTGTAGTVKEGC